MQPAILCDYNDKSSMELFLESKDTKYTSIKEAAKSAFANHNLASCDSHWECKNEDNLFYAFKVAILPGMITLWGDVGTLVIDSVDHPSITWLINHVDQPLYILEKCTLAKPNYFYSGDFKNYIQSLNNPEINNYINNDWSEYSYSKYKIDYLDGAVSAAVLGHRPVTIWCYQALLKFANLV